MQAEFDLGLTSNNRRVRTGVLGCLFTLEHTVRSMHDRGICSACIRADYRICLAIRSEGLRSSHEAFVAGTGHLESD